VDVLPGLSWWEMYGEAMQRREAMMAELSREVVDDTGLGKVQSCVPRGDWGGDGMQWSSVVVELS
jgi:hypothetical protein